MITLSMMLLPGGSGIGRQEVVSGTIWTTDCGKFHAYSLVQDNKLHTGRIAKEQSGHRNPFHLLQGIAADILAQECQICGQ